MQSPTPQPARKIESVLRKQTNWNKLWFYQKTVVLYQMTYQTKKEEEFVTEGGIRERMTAARLGYRTNQRETVEQLTHQVEALQRENAMLKEELEKLKK